MFGFLKSRKFWFTLGGVVAACVLLFVLFFYLFLPSYTRHGKSVTVPDLTKLKLDEAIAALEEAGLQHEVADSVFQANREPLDIVSQEPPATSKVKPGRKIYLVVNKTVPPMVKFPEGVTGVSNYQAKLRLESWNLQVKDFEFKPSPYRNLVLEAKHKGRTVKPGELLPVGSQIVLIVGQGEGDELVPVPDLVGKPYEEALDLVSRLGLNLGSQVWEVGGGGREHGIVFKQSPAYSLEDSVRLGSEMLIWISGEQPAETQENIDTDGQ
jgi:beta-lactam-binding protein with PASTA domain